MKLKKILLPAAVLTVLGSMNASAHLPGESTPHPPPPNAATVGEAYNQYMGVVSAVGDTLKQAPAYATDPTGHVDVMTGMMRSNFDNAMGSSAASFRGRPRWNEFDSPNMRIGVDNPDTRYLGVHLPNASGQNIYRIWGNRSNSVDMILLVNDGTNPQGGGAVLEDEDMVNLKGNKSLKKNDDFEVFVSTVDKYDPSYMHNWMEIGANDSLNVSSRYTMCDYKMEKPGKIMVERVGTQGVIITGEEFRNEESMIKGIGRATAVMHNQQPFWGTIASMIRNSPLPANFAPPFTATGGVGIQTQLSSFMHTDLEDDDALIITYRADTPAVYGSVQAWNDWGSSLPWGHASVNMNYLCDGSLSEATDDGLVHIVVSKQDPGVHNWIDTMGLPILLLNRLQGVDPDHREAIMAQLPIAYGGYMPATQVVKVADLATALPEDTVWVNANRRAKQIKTRQDYQRKKYSRVW